METLESRLRDEFRRPVDLDSLLVTDGVAAARRIRRRRSIRHAALSGVAVAAIVTTTIATMSSVPSRKATPEAQPAPIPSVVDWTRYSQIGQPHSPGGDPIVAAPGAQFADPMHGFVIFQTCTGTDIASCRYDLRSTSNGGVTFVKRPGPPGVRLDPDSVITAIDANHVVIQPFAYIHNGVLPDRSPAGWASSDGGRTWRRTSQAPIGATDQVVPGTRLTTLLPDDDHPQQLATIDTNGDLDVLTTAPPGLGSFRQRSDMPLVAGATNGIYTSTDLGQSWRLTSLPPNNDHELTTVLGTSGGRMYAVTGPIKPGGLSQIRASADFGATSIDIPLPQLTPLVTSTASSQDGVQDRLSVAFSPKYGLLLNDGARTWHLAAGGTTFEPADQPFPIVSVSDFRGSDILLATSADMRRAHPAVTQYISTDGGVHWQPVHW